MCLQLLLIVLVQYIIINMMKSMSFLLQKIPCDLIRLFISSPSTLVRVGSFWRGQGYKLVGEGGEESAAGHQVTGLSSMVVS